MNSKPQENSLNQPTLWDALAAADAAIKQVDENADEGWKRAAERSVWEWSQSGGHFTTDDVMDSLEGLGVTTHDNRALGPVMRKMIRNRVIQEVGMTRSRRRHGARIPVYAGVPVTNERGK